MTNQKLVPVKRCAACGSEKPVSEMKICMHNQMHRYVCDSKCMNDFYNPPKNPRSDAAAPAVQGEPTGQRCEYCDGTGDVHSIDGEWRGVCDCQQPVEQQPDVAQLVDALEEIVKQYPNPNISHEKFRVHACRHAESALAAHRKQGGDA